MNLLIIGPFPLPIHGCSLANDVLLRQLKNKRINVSVIDTNTENVSSKNIGSFSFKKIITFFKCYRYCGKIRKVDLVYSTPGQTFFGIVKYIPFYSLCLLFKIPYIIHLHGNHLGQEFKNLKGFKRKIFKYYITRAAAGVVLSENLKFNFDGLLNENQIFTVENFAEDNLLSSEVVKPFDQIRVLYLSNLMKEKGILEVLNALQKLKKQGVKFKADIAGKIEDESENEINEYLNDLKDFVTYHGIVQGKFKENLLKESNVFILPTYYKMEGQPIALIEAMATGNIIITTKHAGIPDVINDSNGFFVEKKNSTSIYEVLLELNQNLEENVKTVGEHNLKYVKENFSELQFANKILKLILAIK